MTKPHDTEVVSGKGSVDNLKANHDEDSPNCKNAEIAERLLRRSIAVTVIPFLHLIIHQQSQFRLQPQDAPGPEPFKLLMQLVFRASHPSGIA